MVKFSKIMFFMLLCCLLPSVSNAKIEKVEKYQWTGYSGGTGCTTTHGTCEEQKGYDGNGCPIWGKKDQDAGYKYRGCPYATNTKDACDGLSQNLQEMSRYCDCPDGMIDITDVLERSTEVSSNFHDLYQVTTDEVTYSEFGYEELNSSGWTKKKKYCVNVKKLRCIYGNKTLDDIAGKLGMNSKKPLVSKIVEDSTSKFSYNDYTFYNDKPEFVLKAKGFNFDRNTCLVMVEQENFLPYCNGKKCDETIESNLIYFERRSICKENYREDGDITVELWDGTSKTIYYCKGCGPTDIADGQKIVTGKSTVCDKELYDDPEQKGESYGFYNNAWQKNYCTLCKNSCHTDVAVSGAYLYIKTPARYNDLIGLAAFTSGTTGGHCPITCPAGTDVAFATTQKTAASDDPDATSAEFDPCGEYSNGAVNAYLSYDINVASNNGGGTLVCANAVSCNRKDGYVEPCGSAEPHWCSFWVSGTVLPKNPRSTACGYACDGNGQTGVEPRDNRGLFKKCECSTKGYTYKCDGYEQEGSGTACTADPDTATLYYQGCNCPANYKICGDGSEGVGTPCTEQPTGKTYYESCVATGGTDPEVSEGEITNYCTMGGDNIKDTVMCHITALQKAAQSSKASITGYEGDNKEFIPVNKTIQLVPLVIKSKAHYNGVYKMLNNFTTDGKPLMYYDGENWKSDESREYNESYKYAINPYVYSYKFIEQGIHWLTSINGESSQFAEFSETMNNTKDNLTSPESVINKSYIVNLKDGNAGITTTYLHPILGGKYPDEGFPVVEEGMGGITYYYVPNLETSLTNLQKALEKLNKTVGDLDPEKTTFWYYLVNGYLQVDAQYYPQ